MKTEIRFAVSLAVVLCASHVCAGTDVAADWNTELRLAQQAYSQDADARARADATLQSALAAIATNQPPAAASRDAAAAQAAYSVLSVLYPGRNSSLDSQLANSLAAITDTPAATEAGRDWGKRVAAAALAASAPAPSSRVALASSTAGPIVGSESSAETTDAIPAGRYRFSVVAGTRGVAGTSDGIGAAARFDNPNGIAIDAAGNLYVSEGLKCTIRKITPAGVVTTVAGASGEKGTQDGAGAVARFWQPYGLAVDAAGNVFVADRENQTIRRIDPTGLVTTIAGTPGKLGTTDGPAGTGLLYQPSYVALDDGGNLFVSDKSGIRKVAPDGTISSLDLDKSKLGYATGFGPVRVDHAGNVYAISTDWWDYSEVVKFTPNSEGRYVGQPIRPNPKAMPLEDIAYSWANAVALDGAGNVLIPCFGGIVFAVAPTGELQVRFTVEGAEALSGAEVAVDPTGRIFTLPGINWGSSDRTIRIGVFDPNGTGPVIRENPIGRSRNAGDYVQFKVVAFGTPAPTYQWRFNGAPISGATKATFEMNAVQMSDAGTYTVVVTDSGGSVTSDAATLIVAERPVTAPGGGTGSGGGNGSTPPSSSGGGSFDEWSALAIVALIAGAFLHARGLQNAGKIDRKPGQSLAHPRFDLICTNERENAAHG